jgi:hypothetical protein
VSQVLSPGAPVNLFALCERPFAAPHSRPLPPLPHAAGAEPPPPCVDKEAGCAGWAAAGECAKNGAFMRETCAAACGACATPATRGGSGRLTLPRPLPVLLLNNGVAIPAIGFGSAALGTGTQAAVEAAVKVGYRHVDGAMAREWYREDLVGAAVRASGVERERVFLTTKVWGLWREAFHIYATADATHLPRMGGDSGQILKPDRDPIYFSE